MARGRKKGSTQFNLKLDINEDWFIKADNTCYVLCHKRENGPEENVSYHRTMTEILNSYSENKLRRSKISNWEQVVEELKSIKQEIQKISNVFKGMNDG